MAFTRQNLGQDVSFTRDGVLTQKVSTPPFQVFSVSTSKSIYSLGGSWTLRIESAANELSFDYKGTDVFKLTQTGPSFDTISVDNCTFSEVSILPSNPTGGSMVNHSGELKIYI